MIRGLVFVFQLLFWLLVLRLLVRTVGAAIAPRRSSPAPGPD